MFKTNVLKSGGIDVLEYIVISPLMQWGALNPAYKRLICVNGKPLMAILFELFPGISLIKVLLEEKFIASSNVCHVF